MSLLTSFRAKVSKFIDDAYDAIVALASVLAPKLGAKIQVALEDVAEVALQAVIEQAPKLLKGEVKFDNAVKTVVASVSASGKTIAVQTAQAAVQIAYLEAQKAAQALLDKQK